MNLPPPSIRPVFGLWVDLPRERWTTEQATEYGRQSVLYRNGLEAFNAVLPSFVAEINNAAKGAA